MHDGVAALKSPTRRCLASVVVPTIGRGSLAYVAECLAQQTVHLDVVVVNDTAESRVPVIDRAVRTISDAGHGVRVVPLGGRGLSAARNAGVELATAPIVCFLDDDDVVCPHHVERLANTITRGASFATAATAVVKIGTGNEVSVRSTGFGWPDLHDKLRVTNVIAPSSVAVRRDIAPTFDVRLPVQEDWDAWLRISSAGNAPAFSPWLTCGYVKNLATADAPTIRASSELSSLRSFIEYRDRILGTTSSDSPAVLRRRRDWEAVLRSWERRIGAGEVLPFDYYEGAVADLFGVAERVSCCDFSFAAVLEAHLRLEKG